jgi:hypothetical protein
MLSRREFANGYSYDAVKIFMPAGAKKPVYAPYVEHMPPDVTACIFWMKNRMPERWRDVQNVDHVLGKYIIADRPMTEEEWARERATIIDETPIEEKAIEELPAPKNVDSNDEINELIGRHLYWPFWRKVVGRFVGRENRKNLDH